VDDAHRAGSDNTADEASNNAAPDSHVSRELVGPSVP
jgi:hypothetical protein